MSAKDDALGLRQQGFNCAQSVLAALGKYTGLPEETALAIAGGLGSGANCGELCGAVTSAVMAMGLAFPYAESGDAQARAKIKRMALGFTRDFSEQFGCVRCFDLKRGGHPCSELIAWAAEQAEKKIRDN